MCWRLYRLYFATNVQVFYFIPEVCYGRVGRIVVSKHFDSFLHLVRTIDVIDWEDMSIR